MRQKKYTGWFFLLPGFLGVSLFYLIPFLDVVRSSFTQAVGGNFVGAANYQTVFTNQAFLLASKNTMRFAAVCLPLLLLISLGIAVLVQRLETWAGFLKGAYLVPLAIPAASVVLLWQLLFDRRGFLNGLLHLTGWDGVDWMNTGASFGVLVFSYIWKNLGYDVVLWIAGLSMVPKEVYEAARVDGAGEWRCFFYITLPGIRPAAFTIVVISFLNSFKVFREAYLVAGNYPHDDIYLLQHLFNNWFRDLSMDKMAAGAVTMALVIFILVCLLQKSWDKN